VYRFSRVHGAPGAWVDVTVVRMYYSSGACNLTLRCLIEVYEERNRRGGRGSGREEGEGVVLGKRKVMS